MELFRQQRDLSSRLGWLGVGGKDGNGGVRHGQATHMQTTGHPAKSIVSELNVIPREPGDAAAISAKLNAAPRPRPWMLQQ
jgi:hypothetical protein